MLVLQVAHLVQASEEGQDRVEVLRFRGCDDLARRGWLWRNVGRSSGSRARVAGNLRGSAAEQVERAGLVAGNYRKSRRRALSFSWTVRHRGNGDYRRADLRRERGRLRGLAHHRK